MLYLETREISPEEDLFSKVLRLRYELLDQPLGSPEVTEPSGNDLNPANFHTAVLLGTTVLSAARTDMLEEGVFKVRKMVTRPEYQGHGLGRRVMGSLETKVQRLGGRMIWLNANPEAVGFYEKLGYEHTGAIHEFMGLSHPEMVKSL